MRDPRPTFVIDTARLDLEMAGGQCPTIALAQHGDSREIIGPRVAIDAADAVALVFVDALAAWGVPEVMIVDAAPASLPLARLCQRLGVGIEHTSPYRPYAKGRLERAFRDLRVHLSDLGRAAR